jgi:uncharacterized membrane protein YjjB (DUF3815 family)
MSGATKRGQTSGAASVTGKLGDITKAGDRYLRSLFCVGALAVIRVDRGSHFFSTLFQSGLKACSTQYSGCWIQNPPSRMGRLTVPATIVMIPGVYAYQMLVLSNHGRMLDAVQAAASCGFILGAMAAGLAAARFITHQ